MLDKILATLVNWPSQVVRILGPHHKDAWGKSDYTSVINNACLRNFDQIIFPDHSAGQRFKETIVASYRQTTCIKKRDQDTGKIVSYEVPYKFLNSELPAQDLIVVDDLCDGGRTFLELAKQINRKHSLTLFVIHGVFSGNALPDLLQYYNKIIVSNSLGKY
jgi:ribose-phosphate pyrophosphokinase